MNFSQTTEPYETQYMDILQYIIKYGYKQTNLRTGVDTLRIPHASISVDLEEEFPILKSKQVFWKSAADEILWIMQRQSNNVNDLNSHIWDSWADETGSIGKSYGYQIGKEVVVDGMTYPSQVHYILRRLAADSSDRRAVLDLWNVDDMDQMNLVPCCYSSVWDIIDGKLNCMLSQRSCDYLVGVPFNTTQYAILTHLFARHLGVGVGRLTHCMADVHVYCYDSHLEGAEKMIKNYKKLDDLGYVSDSMQAELSKGNSDVQHYVDVLDSVPELKINTPDTDFFSVKSTDIAVDDYKFMEKIKFDVAV